MLRHQFSFLAFLIMSTSISMAQITQINPYYGITLPMPLQTYNGEFNTEGGNNFGQNVSGGQWTSEPDFTVNPFYEFQYNYHKSPLSYYAYGSGDLENLGVPEKSYGPYSLKHTIHLMWKMLPEIMPTFFSIN